MRARYILGVALGLAVGLVGCSSDVDDDDGTSNCGDGVIGEGEECEGTDLGGATCESRGFPGGGTLGCNATCQFDESGCEGSTDNCGNGLVDSGEECDGLSLGGATCVSLGLDPGTLGCNSDCTYNTEGCSSGCGNGTIDSGEECDGSNLNNTTCEELGFVNGGTLDCLDTCAFDMTDCEAGMDVGGPCESDFDCNGGYCLEEAGPNHWGQAGGYCYEACDSQGLCPLSGPNGICVTFGSQNFCVKACDLANPDCREAQECTDLGGVGFCYWGFCDDDSQCEVTGDCETNSLSDNYGWCVSPPEDCTNGVDDDFDDGVDCGDDECTGMTNCPPGEICGNGIDDDGDTFADCDDAECSQLGVCTGGICSPPSGANLTCGTSLSGESNFGSGSTDIIEGANCVSPDGSQGGFFINEWGPEYAYNFSVTQDRLVTITISNYTGDLDIYIIKQYLGSCDPNVGCFAYGGEGVGVDEVITFAAYAGESYYVVVDGFHGNESTYDVDVTCAATGFEVCSGGGDEDSDGLVDCADPECIGVSTCDTETDCTDMTDDDLDGAVDCFDSDCSTDATCQDGGGYWEMWNKNGAVQFDLVNQVLSFSVNAAVPEGYDLNVSAGSGWIVAPGSGTTSTALNIADAGNFEFDLPFSFPFQSASQPTIWITDDGYVSFTDESGAMPGPLGWNVYQAPRIGPLWTDLDPTTGTITLDEFTDHVVITWDGLETPAGSVGNQAQVVLYNNGTIEMTWLAVESVSNLGASTFGIVTLVGDEVGQPPPMTNFVP